MNPKIAVAVGLVAILGAMFVIPRTAFAADVNVSIVSGASTLADKAFDPNPVQVKVGDKVIWTNKDNTPHTATSGTPDKGPDGMFGGNADAGGTIILAGKTEEFTFTKEGEFPYFCTLHPTMTGKVVVAAAGPTGPQPFTVKATIGSQSFDITGKSDTVKATSAKINAGKSVQVTFDKAGQVELTLPPDMISGIPKTGGVKAGSQEVQYTMTGGTGTTPATLKFTIPQGSTTVEIMGTKVIPEFPVIAALILAASLVAIVGYTRLAKSGTGFFGRT